MELMTLARSPWVQDEVFILQQGQLPVPGQFKQMGAIVVVMVAVQEEEEE